MLFITSQIKISLSELKFSYARSSGPGGQNVNKVNSKAILRWNIIQSPSIPEKIRTRIIGHLGNRINHEGEIVLFSDKFRDQARNRNDCIKKFQKLISLANFVPKLRKATLPSFSSIRKIKSVKARHSKKKLLRKKSHPDD